MPSYIYIEEILGRTSFSIIIAYTVCEIADTDMEESKLNSFILSIEKAHPTLLFFHTILHNSPANHVRSRG